MISCTKLHFITECETGRQGREVGLASGQVGKQTHPISCNKVHLIAGCEMKLAIKFRNRLRQAMANRNLLLPTSVSCITFASLLTASRCSKKMSIIHL